MKLIIILVLILFILTGVKLVNILQKKGIFINRWIFGFAAFLIVLIPSVFFDSIPNVGKNLLYVLSGLFAIMFFETGRIMIEKNEIKGMVRSDQFPKTAKKKTKVVSK